MSDSSSTTAVMTKAQASTRFKRLKLMSECVQNEDSFYALYLGIARSILAAHQIPSSTGTTPAELPDPLEVKDTMKDMLPPSLTVFADD
eukprot:IDg916t1